MRPLVFGHVSNESTLLIWTSRAIRVSWFTVRPNHTYGADFDANVSACCTKLPIFVPKRALGINILAANMVAPNVNRPPITQKAPTRARRSALSKRDIDGIFEENFTRDAKSKSISKLNEMLVYGKPCL
jgi:hypothetical protein